MSNYLLGKHNVTIIVKQLFYKLSVLRTIKSFASNKVMHQIATAIIIGKISYAPPLWENIPQIMQQRFQHIILTAARICLGHKHTRDSTTKLPN